MKSYRIVAASPPPLNHLYRKGKGNTYLTQLGKSYREHIHALVIQMKAKPFKEDVEVEIVWTRKEKRGDVDGKFKILLDAMQSKHARWQTCFCGQRFGCYVDDKQVRRLTIERTEGEENRVDVLVRGIK